MSTFGCKAERRSNVIAVDRVVELQYLGHVFWPWGSSMELRSALFWLREPFVPEPGNSGVGKRLAGFNHDPAA